jgi:hypothetical protein
MLAFVSMTHSITIFPTAFITAIETLSLCTSIPIYLALVIKGVLSGRVELNTQNHTPKGAPFYIASVKEECLAKLILLGEGSLRRALRHYEAHYHEERNHRGKDNVLLFPLPTQAVRGEQEEVRCRERLGGLLKYYEREAA